jgi:hypothetical protein
METLRNSARELEPLQRLFPWIWQSRPLRSRDNLLLSSSFFAFAVEVPAWRVRTPNMAWLETALKKSI